MKVCGQDKSKVLMRLVGIAESAVFEHIRREDRTRTRDGKAISFRSFREPLRPNREQLMIPIRVRFDPPQVWRARPDDATEKEPPMRRMKITESTGTRRVVRVVGVKLLA